MNKFNRAFFRFKIRGLPLENHINQMIPYYEEIIQKSASL